MVFKKSFFYSFYKLILKNICKRKERYKTIRFQENANRIIKDYKINEFLKFLKLLHKDSSSNKLSISFKRKVYSIEDEASLCKNNFMKEILYFIIIIIKEESESLLKI
jgi:hypothetical protein